MASWCIISDTIYYLLVLRSCWRTLKPIGPTPS